MKFVSNTFAHMAKVVSLLLLSLLAIDVCAGSGIQVLNAWSPPMPPKATVRAGYLTLRNESEEEITVTRVQSTAFEMISMHQTSNDNGVMSMAELSKVSIPPGGTLNFEPGGLHLMMMGLKQALRKGDTFSVEMHLSNGQSIQFDVLVQRKYDELLRHSSYSGKQRPESGRAQSL